jgi:dehydrogenase/reductase SDR family protein 4
MSQSLRFLNKVAVVTGSTEGIGFSIAERLAKEGAKVVVSSRKQAKVDKAVDQLKSQNLDVHGLTCHVGKQEDRTRLIESAVEKYGGIDMLVSNAAANPHFGNVFDIDESNWDKIFDTNVKSTFFTIKEAIPHLEKRKNSSILIISSVAAYAPFRLIAPYSISKTALLGITKAIAPQCAEQGIRVNCLAPGVIKTNFSKALWSNEDILREQEEQMCFQKRMGTCDEMAGTAAFLLSEDANYITGETIIADGGSNSRL